MLLEIFYQSMAILLVVGFILKLLKRVWSADIALLETIKGKGFSMEEALSAYSKINGWEKSRIDFLADIILESAVWGAIFAVPLLFSANAKLLYGVGVMEAQLFLRFLLVLTNKRMGYDMEVTMTKNNVVVANFDIKGFNLLYLHGEDYHNERANISWISFLSLGSGSFAFRGSLIGRRIKAVTYLDSEKVRENSLVKLRRSFKKKVENNPLFVCGVEYDSNLQIRGKIVFKEGPLLPGAHPRKQYIVEVELYCRLVGYDDMHEAQSYANALIHDHFLELA